MIKVKLRLATGIITNSILISKDCLYTELRLCVIPKLSNINDIRTVSEHSPNNEKYKYLVFNWDFKSKWGNTEIPIMDIHKIDES
jgi:hypothetical protein